MTQFPLDSKCVSDRFTCPIVVISSRLVSYQVILGISYMVYSIEYYMNIVNIVQIFVCIDKYIMTTIVLIGVMVLHYFTDNHINVLFGIHTIDIISFEVLTTQNISDSSISFE